ncbi:MAG: RNA methyltransferase [Rikenellaceae bacterium]
MIKSEIQFVRSLGDKKVRQELGLFVAEGEKFIEELVGSSLRVRKVYLTDDSSNDFDTSAFAGAAEVEYISNKEMERITMLKTANKALALVEMPHYALDSEVLSGSLTLVLDGVQNPGNLGTIIRLADWFGITDIICSPTCADCFNPKVVQATMGAILRVRVHYTELEPLLQRVDVPIYGALLQGGENIYDADLSLSEKGGGIIVMGSEGQGISPAIEALVTNRIFIPPYPIGAPSSESLNVAIATSIICSEFRRRG